MKFEQYYNTNFNKLLRWIKYNYPNMDDHENLLQETFVKFYERYYNNWDSKKSTLDTYFRNYLIFESLNYIKGTKHIKSIDEEFDGVKLSDILVDETLNNTLDFRLEIYNKIKDGLNDKKKRNLDLLLMNVNGMTLKQISEKENIHLNRLKATMQRTRQYFCHSNNLKSP